MAAVLRRALSGAGVTLDGPFDLGRPFVSWISFRLGSQHRRFSAGALDHGSTIASELEIELSEEYGHQDGRLRIGHKSAYDDAMRMTRNQSIGVWEGSSYSSKLVIHNGTSKDLLGLYEQFRLSETPEGLSISPADPGTVTTVRDPNRAPKIVQNVPGVGLAEVVEMTQERAKQLPNWRGRSVRGGELFVEDRGTPEMTFLLVAETSATRLYPNWWEASEEDILDRFSEALVTWQ